MHPLARVALFIAAAVVLGTTALHAQAPVRFTSEDGRSTAAVGLLVQPQFDVELSRGSDTASSLCLRRVRALSTGTIRGALKFYVATDAPYLGLHTDNRQVTREVFLQDLVLTYEVKPAFMVDGGLVIVPLSYNTLQSAASLLTPSYGPYSFLASGPTTSRVGRDYGVQARGYVFGKHLEYRAGAFQGHREIEPDAPLRYAGRVAWHVLDRQTSLSYTGTSLGRKQLLSFGSSVDHQDTYTAWSLDAHYDRPIHRDNALTLQAGYIHYDGDATFAGLPQQGATLAEAGYFVGRWKTSVFTQVARRDFAGTTGGDATSWQSGVGYYARGHRLNVKGAVGRVTTIGKATRTQFTVQTQVFLF